MRIVQKVSNHVMWKIETFLEEDTRYKKHYTKDNDTSVHFKVGTLGPHTISQLPSAALSYFPESHRWSEISSFSQVTLVLGKARSCRTLNLGCRGAESPGWFDVLPKNSAWDMMYEWAHCHDEAANPQLPTAVALSIIRIVSMEECSSSMQNLMQICCSTHSVILNVTATQYTCSFSGAYHPHYYSKVVIIHACTFQSTLLGCQVTLIFC